MKFGIKSDGVRKKDNTENQIDMFRYKDNVIRNGFSPVKTKSKHDIRKRNVSLFISCIC